jgi:hypothetical protein
MRLKRRQGLQRRKSQPANVAHSWAYCVTSQACDLPLRLKDDSFYAAKVSAPRQRARESRQPFRLIGCIGNLLAAPL